MGHGRPCREAVSRRPHRLGSSRTDEGLPGWLRCSAPPGLLLQCRSPALLPGSAPLLPPAEEEEGP